MLSGFYFIDDPGTQIKSQEGDGPALCPGPAGKDDFFLLCCLSHFGVCRVGFIPHGRKMSGIRSKSCMARE